ncbi:FAD-dependent monooxygenase [Longimycelium tulufanense]|uniref:FAD-dependent monooxygenase n=1 Tax=Longimycelium tulufanense TaxID=907463 RepID=A0A8J3CBB7_9PSEU|nr:FAD-dependent monooxygenase [Longimycelium tulufanense]GGM34148.1 FAD-dependent monooxygenase [Longimycelium tulufanense]
MKVLVVGTGVGGLTTAIALRRRGIEVELFEAASEPRTSGGGLGIACNATKVLRALGVDLSTAGVGRVCDEFHLRTPTGKPLRELPIRSVADEVGTPLVNVRRSDLTTLLRNSLGDTPIHYGAEVVRYDGVGDSVSITCADGRSYTGDVLVGADGINSAIRAQMVGQERVNDYGYVCWIAAAPFEHPSLPAGGAVHYWGNGQRFGLMDIGGGQAYWWGTKNVARRWSGTKGDILQCFAGWANEVLDVISRTPESDIATVPAQDRTFLESWGDGPVTLVGDAAHPMLTSLSQGGSSSIEDGYALAHHLAAGTEPVAGLRAYERTRRDHARWLVSASRRLSRLEQLENPIVARLRDLAFRYAPMSIVRSQIFAAMRFELPA